ncbi:hypothetical protein TKK_0002638 [Trichogramma kaykai]
MVSSVVPKTSDFFLHASTEHYSWPRKKEIKLIISVTYDVESLKKYNYSTDVMSKAAIVKVNAKYWGTILHVRPIPMHGNSSPTIQALSSAEKSFDKCYFYTDVMSKATIVKVNAKYWGSILQGLLIPMQGNPSPTIQDMRVIVALSSAEKSLDKCYFYTDVMTKAVFVKCKATYWGTILHGLPIPMQGNPSPTIQDMRVIVALLYAEKSLDKCYFYTDVMSKVVIVICKATYWDMILHGIPIQGNSSPTAQDSRLMLATSSDEKSLDKSYFSTDVQLRLTCTVKIGDRGIKFKLELSDEIHKGNKYRVKLLKVETDEIVNCSRDGSGLMHIDYYKKWTDIALFARTTTIGNPHPSWIRIGKHQLEKLKMTLSIIYRIRDGRIYNISNETTRVYYLRCRNRQSGCFATARVYRDNVDVLVPGQPHSSSCIPSEEAVGIVRFKEELRLAATRDFTRPRVIYDTLALVYDDVAALVPFSSVRGSIKRWRATMFPLSPNSLIDMSLQLGNPENSRLLFHERGRLTTRIFHDIDDEMHFLLYDADIVAKVQNHISTIMIDFTYNTCPVVPDANLQLGTVMCIYHGHAIPVLWFIMSRKTTNAYRKMCSLIGELFAASNILTIVTDFELPLRVALRETFGPTVYLIGCFFHYLRCLHGKIHRLGLTDFVRENEEANSFVRKCGALALVPAGLMVAIFDQLLELTPERIRRPFQDFITYIRTFWFTRVGPRNFSVYGVHTRTNNAIESYHSILSYRLGADPPFWQWLGNIKRMVQWQWIDFATMESGRTSVRHPSNATRFRGQRLQQAWRDLHLSNVSGFELLTICSNVIGEYFTSHLNSIQPLEVEEVIQLEVNFDARLDQNEGNDPEYDYSIFQDFRRNEALVLDANIPAEARPRWLRAQGGRRQRRRRRRNNNRPYGINGNVAARPPLPRRNQRSPRNDEQAHPRVAERNNAMQLRTRSGVARPYPFYIESDSDEDVVSSTMSPNVSRIQNRQPLPRPLDRAIAGPSTAVDGPSAARVNHSRVEGGSERELVAAGPSGISVHSESDSDGDDVSAMETRSGSSHREGPIISRPLIQENAPTVSEPMTIANDQSRPSNDSNDAGTCSVCMYRPKTHSFVPCGHWTCCEWCAIKIMMDGKICPNCRAEALCTVRISLSMATPSNDSMNRDEVSRPVQVIAPTASEPMSDANDHSMVGLSNGSIIAGTCSVCKCRPKTNCFVPCGHWPCCEWCAIRIMMDEKECPDCRAEAVCTTKIFQ